MCVKQTETVLGSRRISESCAIPSHKFSLLLIEIQLFLVCSSCCTQLPAKPFRRDTLIFRGKVFGAYFRFIISSNHY